MAQAHTEIQTARTVVFDENGQTVEETVSEETVPELEASGEAEPGDQTENVSSNSTPPAGKYRIGDRTFQTQDEALVYAQSQVSALETEQQIADAYRQGMREALQPTVPAQQNVTPAASALNTEELYTNPTEFLEKYKRQIKTETQSEWQQTDNMRRESERIWSEFTARHPALAEFRTEVENFVAASPTEIRAIIATKGFPASYDYIATKLKSRFESYANAVKPKRELPNGSAGASPSSKVSGVTPKNNAEKPLSFSEQIRSIRKRR